MIVAANTPYTLDVAKEILQREIGVKPTQDLRAIFWVSTKHKIEWVVAYDGFIGKVCQMHVVNLGGKMTPKKLLWAAFDYPFNQAGMSAVLGVVNSKNTDAMRYDMKLGFKEINRIEGAHDDGGDVVLFRMDKADCKWIKEVKHEKQLVAA